MEPLNKNHSGILAQPAWPRQLTAQPGLGWLYESGLRSAGRMNERLCAVVHCQKNGALHTHTHAPNAAIGSSRTIDHHIERFSIDVESKVLLTRGHGWRERLKAISAAPTSQGGALARAGCGRSYQTLGGRLGADFRGASQEKE